MSIVLPNGSTIYPRTIEGLEAVTEKLRNREPIVVRLEANGVIEERVLCHPDDPVSLPALPRAYVLPERRGFFERLWRRRRSPAVPS